MDGDGAVADVEVPPGDCMVMLKQPVNPSNTAANIETVAKWSLTFIPNLLTLVYYI
jgi:hypothetical protein